MGSELPLASVDGTIGADVLSVHDDGLLRGDGVFEVCRVYAGRVFAFDEHLERMQGSAANLRLAFDPRIRSDGEALVRTAGPVDAALRLVLTRGGRRIAILEPLREQAPSIALAAVEYVPTRILDGVKSLSYGANMLASRVARERGADDALLVTPHGRVLELPTSAFFYVLGDELCTPPLADHVLDSITRRRLMGLARERVTTLDDVRAASEAFAASTLREVQPVRALDGHALPAAPGPWTERAAEAFARLRPAP
jgi:branched-subunit amino acid aminotransferase/4-amino-4-deoxychorismate lyase